MQKPVIAVTMGDAAGIGPEISLKAALDPQVRLKAQCVIVGELAILQRAATACGLDVPFAAVTSPQRDRSDDAVQVIDIGCLNPKTFVPGRVDADCGQAAYQAIRHAVQLTQSGQADALATGPVNKESLRAGGVDFIGHTEILADLTHTRDPLTLFEVRGLRIFFLTRHVSLRQACDLITRQRIIDYVLRCRQALDTLGIPRGTMAVAGLNPHSGEHGLFGDEEMQHIAPAVQALRSRGLDVEGPIGADSVFHLALSGRYHSVLSLYHDQGHIAAKTYDFERTVSITCGMPILRTSVDHGTALDISYQNTASPVSMIEAVLVAAKYAPHFAPPAANR